MPCKVSLFTADNRISNAVEKMLRKSGGDSTASTDGKTLWQTLQARSSDLVVADRRLFHENAIDVLSRLREVPDPVEVVVLIARDEVGLRAELLAAGAMAVLSRETQPLALAAAVQTLADRASKQRSVRALQRLTFKQVNLRDISTRSPKMLQLLDIAQQVAPSESSLLLQGETGTGKEHLARAIHQSSTRSAGPFVPLHCAALSEGLLESELFGHVEGAFTGASRSRRGYFELADGGTIFLDEIGELSQTLQVKLLRVLQERSIQPVGGESVRPISVRFMAATNRNLVQEVQEGRFRDDLYYRLSVVSLELPPLRERREDIEQIAKHFLRTHVEAIHRQIKELSSESLEAVLAYDWPGNIRELMNVLERAVLLSTSQNISVDSLPFATKPTAANFTGQFAASITQEPIIQARDRVVAEFETHYLSSLLTETHGRISLAAHRARLNPRSLYEKLRRYGLRKEDFRDRE
jgi:DNA-binding NtrC family response regulator